MKKILSLLLCTVLFLSIFAGCGGSEGKSDTIDSFSVGYAKVDITPTGSVPLSGFGDNLERMSNQVMDPLYATCVAFSDTEGNTVLLFGTDLLNSYGNVITDLRQKIAEETGVPFSHIQFSGSHTHSGYDQGSDGVGTVAEANRVFSERCLQAAKDALADRKPAKMYGTFTRPEGLNYLRHYILSDGEYDAYHLGVRPKEEIYSHLWKADNLLQLVKFTREGGKDVVLINWQSHYYGTKNINYYGISADYPGALKNEVEAQLDCHAAFVLGGAGNVNCTSQIPSENHNKGYIEHGKMLAAEAVKAAANFQPLETGTIHLEEYPFVAEGTIKENYLYTFGFGDFGMAFAPWEIFDVHARGVRDDSQYTYTFYASCANAGSQNMYLAHDASFDYDCYEAATARYPRGTAELVQAKLTEMINSCFAASGQNQKERPEGYTSTPFAPVCDGLEYINPVPGDMSAIKKGKNGFYIMTLVQGTSVKAWLVDNEELAKQLCEKTTMKLLVDDRNVIVGIAE